MKKETMVEFGGLLKSLRKSRKMTQSEFANGICDRAQMVGIEHGDTKLIDLDFVIAASEKFGIPYTFLLNSVLQPRDLNTAYLKELFEGVRRKDIHLLNALDQKLNPKIDTHRKLLLAIDLYISLFSKKLIDYVTDFTENINFHAEFFDIYTILVIDGFVQAALQYDKTHVARYNLDLLLDKYTHALDYYAPIYPEMIRFFYLNLSELYFFYEKYLVARKFFEISRTEQFPVHYIFEGESHEKEEN